MKKCLLLSLTSFTLASSVSLLSTAIPVQAVNIVSPGSTVAGKTIGEWTADWWQWAFSQSSPGDAFTDTTGEFAGVGQSGPVWFLAGTTGGEAIREFSVPGNKYILIPMVNVSNSEAETGGLTGQELIDLTTGIVDQIDSAFLEINGVSKIDNSNYTDYREVSPIFEYFKDPNSPFPTPVFEDGTSGEAYADGFWAMIEPLGTGTYMFRFGGGATAFDFSVEVKDTITATPEPSSVLALIALGLGLGALVSRSQAN